MDSTGCEGGTLKPRGHAPGNLISHSCHNVLMAEHHRETNLVCLGVFNEQTSKFNWHHYVAILLVVRLWS